MQGPRPVHSAASQTLKRPLPQSEHWSHEGGAEWKLALEEKPELEKKPELEEELELCGKQMLLHCGRVLSHVGPVRQAC